MEEKPLPKKSSLAEIEDVEALKAQYDIFTDRVLLKWMDAVTGSHREAMAAILRERGHLV